MIAVVSTTCLIILARICMQKSSREVLRNVIALAASVLTLAIGFIAAPSASALFLDFTQTPSYITIAVLCLVAVTLPGLPLLKKHPAAIRSIYVRVPFVTVLTEEIIFRGVLLGLLSLTLPLFWSVIIASTLFGLWHIYEPLNSHLSTKQKNRRRLVDVVTTSLAGVLFCLLTLTTETIVASFMLHWIINSTGILISINKRVRNNLHKIY